MSCNRLENITCQTGIEMRPSCGGLCYKLWKGWQQRWHVDNECLLTLMDTMLLHCHCIVLQQSQLLDHINYQYQNCDGWELPSEYTWKGKLRQYFATDQSFMDKSLWSSGTRWHNRPWSTVVQLMHFHLFGNQTITWTNTYQYTAYHLYKKRNCIGYIEFTLSVHPSIHPSIHHQSFPTKEWNQFYYMPILCKSVSRQ